MRIKMNDTFIQYLFFIIAGYLSGSVMYASLLPKVIRQIDIRELSEDGNPGTANAFIHAGIPIGILVIICELLKGALPVWFALRKVDISNLLFALVLAAPVLGHAFPVFWKGQNGGKAIAVSFGVLLGLYPDLTPAFTLAALYILFSLIIIIKPHFFRSVITFLLFTVCCLFDKTLPSAVTAGCFILSITVIGKHFSRYHGEHIAFRLPWGKPLKNR